MTMETARDGLRAGDFTSVELTQAYLTDLPEKNAEMNAYLEIFDDAIEQAKIADQMIASGDATDLTGIPMAIKDNILIKDRKASAASKILSNYVATYDSTVGAKLREAGAVIIGRTNMDEFAMGSSTENSAFGRTMNPIDTQRVPGGSSGGSAAAVAMHGAVYALGSDTGGSIRQPASFCGLVGLYPTYGAVSRYGLMAMSSSLDQIGPFTKTVADAEIVHDAIAGYDPMDATSVPEKTRNENELKQIEPKKIGVPRAIINHPGVLDSVRADFENSLKKLADLGYEIIDIELPSYEMALPTYYIIMPAEASSNLSRYDGTRFGVRQPGKDLLETYMKSRGDGFGAEVRRRIMLGTYVLSAGYYDAYYNKATSVRALIADEFKKAFEIVDAIATPTTPTGAWKAGEMSDPIAMYAADLFTVPANLAGIPAISIPSGADNNNMPLGLHLMASYWDEKTLFHIGKQFQGNK